MNKITKRLLGDIQTLIESTRERTAQTVNSGLVLLYWNIGKRIREVVLREKRAEYGQKILSTLSAKLTLEYGPGFSQRNLEQMSRFFQFFPEISIAQTLSAQLGWSHSPSN